MPVLPCILILWALGRTRLTPCLGLSRSSNSSTHLLLLEPPPHLDRTRNPPPSKSLFASTRVFVWNDETTLPLDPPESPPSGPRRLALSCSLWLTLSTSGNAFSAFTSSSSSVPPLLNHQTPPPTPTPPPPSPVLVQFIPLDLARTDLPDHPSRSLSQRD